MSRRNREPKAKSVSPSLSPSSDPTEIPEDEQWRLIDESAILKRAVTPPDLADGDVPLADEIFNAAILVVPFSFLLLMMEILIHYQYGKHPTFRALVDRMITGVPILSIFIFYSTRYKHLRKMQSCFFLTSLIVGPRMIYLINRGSWVVNMKQCPPLATIWIYVIVQLDLVPAVISLAIIGWWVWWKNMKLIF